MKTIGFVDYYINEWHANNYPAWIEKICAEKGLDYKVAYAWAELDTSPSGETTDAWCEKFGVEKCETLEELCEKSDYILVLAPSDPEKHLAYAETVLKYGKRTYIDKTFAPDYETAAKIFALGEKYGAPFFSSSALRYATELTDCKGAEHVIVMGGGGNYDEYIIHQIEMAVKLLGAKPTAIRVEQQGKQYVTRVTFEGEHVATMLFSPSAGFSVYADLTGRTVSKAITSDFFSILLADILHFYETGELSFDGAETLACMKIREAAIAAKLTPGQWRNL